MVKRVPYWGMAAVVAGLLVGCQETPEPKPEDPGDEQPEVVVIEPAVEFPDDDPEQFEPESVEFAGTWPGAADHETFELMWLGGDDEIELLGEARDDAEVVESASWMDGAEFEWLETRVWVEEPGRLEVVEDTTLEATPYDPEFGQLEAHDETYRLEAGEPLFSYRYDGRGSCYLGVETEIVYAECPEEEVDFGGETADAEPDRRWGAEASSWWVRVEAGDTEGWFQVDEAPVEVHQRSVGGYEKLDEPPAERFIE